MTVQTYYKVVLNDYMIEEELWELRETAKIFGIENFDKKNANSVTFTMIDKDEEPRENLKAIAAWFGRIGADASIVTISLITDFHTNYEFEDLNLLLTQDTKGSC